MKRERDYAVARIKLMRLIKLFVRIIIELISNRLRVDVIYNPATKMWGIYFNDERFCYFSEQVFDYYLVLEKLRKKSCLKLN